MGAGAQNHILYLHVDSITFNAFLRRNLRKLETLMYAVPSMVLMIYAWHKINCRHMLLFIGTMVFLRFYGLLRCFLDLSL